MNRNAVSENPRNMVVKIMKNERNKNLNNRLQKVKSTVDNKLVKPLKPSTMKLKQNLAKTRVQKHQATRNEQLLGKIYKIFTRDRPETKGFDEVGQPSTEPRGISTLNEKNRREEAHRINRSNAKILEKLQAVRPSVLTSEDWRQHAQRLDKMSVYMHAYRGCNRSYMGVRASSSASVFRSGKKDYEGSSMPLTPSCVTPFNGSTMRPPDNDVQLKMLQTQQPNSRMNQFFNTTHPSNSSKGVVMQSDVVAQRFGGEPTMILQANKDGDRTTIDHDQLQIDLNLRPQTAGNNGNETIKDDTQFATVPARSIDQFQGQGPQVSSHYNLGPTTKQRLNEHGMRIRRRSTAGGAINQQHQHMNLTGKFSPNMIHQGSSMASTHVNRFKKRLCSEPQVFSEQQIATQGFISSQAAIDSTQQSTTGATFIDGSDAHLRQQRKQALKGGNFRMRQNLNQVTNNLFTSHVASAGSTNSHKPVMDRQYYNQFYKYKNNNAKLLNIRRATRFINSTSGDQVLPQAVCMASILDIPKTGASHKGGSGAESVFVKQYRTLSNASQKHSNGANSLQQSRRQQHQTGQRDDQQQEPRTTLYDANAQANYEVEMTIQNGQDPSSSRERIHEHLLHQQQQQQQKQSPVNRGGNEYQLAHFGEDKVDKIHALVDTSTNQRNNAGRTETDLTKTSQVKVDASPGLLLENSSSAGQFEGKSTPNVAFQEQAINSLPNDDFKLEQDGSQENLEE